MIAMRERQQFEEFVRSQRLRMTAERRELFDEIFAQHGHLDADSVLAGLRARGVAISRATVYRSLDLLVECGLVRKQRLGAGRYLYEHLHPGLEHDHLVCSVCRRVVEFKSPGIAALQTEICRAHGFDPRRHSLQIFGFCCGCAEAAARPSSATAPVHA